MFKYSKKVIEHFAHPRNMGKIKNPDAVGQAGNLKCGDIMKLYLKVKNDIIKDIKFETLGCAAAIAVSSMVTEMVKGKKISQALKISNKAVTQALGGLPPQKFHCSVLAEQTLKSAIENYAKNLKNKQAKRR